MMNSKLNAQMEDRIKGALVGLACADAVGTTVEFRPRGSFEPVTDMVGGGPFRLKPGQWTDDTSMALCLAHSLVHQKGFDPVDQMNRYCNWYLHGYMSSTGDCFDIGGTVSSALRKYLESKEPFCGSTDERSSGNGSIMRLSPIPIFYHDDFNDCIHYAGESSRTTHASPECIDSCKLFSSLIFNAFRAKTKSDVFDENRYEPQCERVLAISKRQFQSLDDSQIKGSGYVIDSLQAALWCFLNGSSYKESILMAVNLGDDADTTAAVCGQIAGAYYGYSQIPKKWSDSISMAKEIESLAVELYKTNST